MAYTRTYTIDAGPAGDTTKAAVATKLDGDLTTIFANLTTHEAMTTNAHGSGTGLIVTSAGTQTLTNKTLTSPTLTGTVTASGATIASPTITGGTATNMTLVTPALGTPSAGILSNCTLATPAAKGVVYLEPKTNLLTNSQWMAMSGSTLEEADATAVTVTDITAGVCTCAETRTLAVGKLIRFDAGGSTANKVYEITALTNDTAFTINDTSITDATDVTGHEVTPGYVAANALAPDGWTKDTTIDIYREHTGTNTKDGSFYSLKTVPSTQNDYLHWPNEANYSTETYLKKFAGRTVTLGMWVKSSTVSDVKLGIYDSVGSGQSSFHTGGGAFEWLEVTRTINTAATYLLFEIDHLAAAPGTAYFSQPMLVFGSSIGEGNYQPIVNEVINAQANIALTDYTASAVAADATINLEAQSGGKIGKGVKAVSGWIEGQNTAADKYLDILSASGGVRAARLYSQVNGKDNSTPFRAVCDSSGDIYVDVEDGNWSNVTIQINAIET